MWWFSTFPESDPLCDPAHSIPRPTLRLPRVSHDPPCDPLEYPTHPLCDPPPSIPWPTLWFPRPFRNPLCDFPEHSMTHFVTSQCITWATTTMWPSRVSYNPPCVNSPPRVSHDPQCDLSSIPQLLCDTPRVSHNPLCVPSRVSHDPSQSIPWPTMWPPPRVSTTHFVTPQEDQVTKPLSST